MQEQFPAQGQFPPQQQFPMEEYKPNRFLQVLTALGLALAWLLLFIGVQIIISIVFTAAVTASVIAEYGYVNELLVMRQVYGYSTLMSLLSNIITLIVPIIIFLAMKRNPLHAIGARKVRPRLAAGGAAVAPLLYAVVILVLSLLPEAWIESYSDASSVLLSDVSVVSVIAVAVAAPIVEEVIFRGLILGSLHRVMPGWLAVLLSAAVFGACHGQWVWMGYAFVLGLVFGLMRLHSGSILPSMLCHLVFNAIGQCSDLIPETDLGGVLFLGGLLGVGVVACILARKGVAELLRPARRASKGELPA